MIPGTRDEKFLNRGSAERFLYRGCMDDCADLLLGIKNHNDSWNKKLEVPKSWKCRKGPVP